MTTDSRQHRLKRLRMRSWRRGTKEMDLVLGPFADAELSALDEGDLALYERMLTENDHDLYAWISGRLPPPPDLAPLLARVAAFSDRCRNRGPQDGNGPAPERTGTGGGPASGRG